jgi:hypothetical protein
VPEELLYHYTTPEGLVGIVEKHEIWATDLAYMNDTTEFRVGLDLVTKHIEQLRGDNLGPCAERWNWLLTALKRTREFGPDTLSSVYACSFSTDGDNLSQWRAYCPNGGFAIGGKGVRAGKGSVLGSQYRAYVTYFRGLTPFPLTPFPPCRLPVIASYGPSPTGGEKGTF